MSAAMPHAPTRAFNNLVTHGWNRLARVYNIPLVQRVAYRPPQDEIIAQLRQADIRRVADVGCGTGILASRIQQDLTPELVYGCDASVGMLRQAKARSGQVNWLNGRAENLGLPDGAVDAVVSTHAFHFFDHPAALEEFHRILSPGGLLAIVLINPRHRFAQLLQPTPIQGVAYFPSPDEMRLLVEAAGFRVTEQRPVHRPVPAVLVPDVLTVARRA
ncbi:methyltransferase domain-containing protein [Nocardia sp. NBC_01499]|uniref:class I SAM-dependent methyltransferase n=1 Tax=Nocardia sp. NBC_01499 TaxID=2903597 RepID=UPI00386DBC3C